MVPCFVDQHLFFGGKLLNSEQSRMSPSRYNLHLVLKRPFKRARKSINFVLIRRETSRADQIYILFFFMLNKHIRVQIFFMFKIQTFH